VQSAWLSSIDLLGARPNLMVVVVLVWTVLRNPEEGLLWGFIGGIATDLLSGGPLGAHTLALVVVALLAGQAWGQGLGSSLFRLLLQAILCVLAYHLVLLTALTWTGRTVDWGYAFTHVLLPSVALNVLLAPIVRPLLAWLERRTRQEGLST
jgi:rod shape-determining protein MreD